MVNGFSSQPSNVSPKPLERLNVYDGLMMNAARWDVAQVYMRQRQNLHFQAINQGGIVAGLGVKVIDPPSGVRRSIQDQDNQRNEKRWLEIQPGVAIDAVGNPIIVSPGKKGSNPNGDGRQDGNEGQNENTDNQRDRSFRLAISPPLSGTLTVYVVVKYVEPGLGNGDRAQPNTITEQFRFDQITTPPGELEVELCRIELPSGPLQLKMPVNVLAPAVGELDLTHRVLAQAKPQAVVRLGVVGRLPNSTRHQFYGLAQAMTTLYPNLQLQLAPEAVIPVNAEQSSRQSDRRTNGQSDRQSNRQSDRQPLPPPPSAMQSSQRPTSSFPEPPPESRLSHPIQNYDLLYVAGQNVQTLVQNHWQWFKSFVQSGGIVMVETLSSTPPEFSSQFLDLFDELTLWADCPPSHWVRTQPFFFTQLPQFDQAQSINVAIAPGLIWVGGGLCKTWGLDHNLPRHDIRTAHELGINLMHYVWRQRYLRHLTHW
ncbi:MAG: hypothetical protein AAGD25_28570 [Cyanobacteria bacterium P01_F01_bin.150]